MQSQTFKKNWQATYGKCILDFVLLTSFPTLQEFNATDRSQSFCCLIENLHAPGSDFKPQPPSTHEHLMTVRHERLGLKELGTEALKQAFKC